MHISNMKDGKKIYPAKLQVKILREAKKTVVCRYGKDETVLAIYLGGSIVSKKFGIYKKPVKTDATPRIGFDIMSCLL